MKKDDFIPNSFDDAEQDKLNRILAEALAPINPPPRLQTSMRTRLMEQVSRSLTEHAGLLTVRVKDGAWQTLKKGIRFKPLWTGSQGSSVLIELEAGAVLPPHRHHWMEEGIVLRGGLQMGDLDLGPLDYHLSMAGSRHESIHSRQGALAFLRGTSLGDRVGAMRELLGGLLPFGNDACQTIYTSKEAGWVTVADGVEMLELGSDGVLSSRFYRLQPGAKVPGHAHPHDEECLMLEGELFIGDILLCQSDYQLAPVGSLHGEAYTDVGATLFVRG